MKMEMEKPPLLDFREGKDEVENSSERLRYDAEAKKGEEGKAKNEWNRSSSPSQSWGVLKVPSGHALYRVRVECCQRLKRPPMTKMSVRERASERRVSRRERDPATTTMKRAAAWRESAWGESI